MIALATECVDFFRPLKWPSVLIGIGGDHIKTVHKFLLQQWLEQKRALTRSPKSTS